jgi:DNA-binding beta-propeller fold protein YncE
MDGTMRLWDIASGQELKRFDGHLTLVAAVAFASDGRRALSGGYDGSVVLWDTATGQELRRWDGLARYVHAIAMTSDGKRAAVAADQMVVLLDLAANRAPATLTGFTAAVTSAAFSPDQRQLVAGSDDGTARIWNLSGAAPIPLHTLTGHVGPIRDVAFSPSGKAILTAGADRSVRLWDAAASKLLARFDRHAQTLVRASFLLGGRQTLSISRDGVTRPWPLTKFLDRVVAADAKSPPATMAASPSPVWKPVAVIPIGGTIGNLALSPNGKWLYLIDRSNGRLVQINTATGKESAEWPVPDPAATFALKPDGKAIFTFAATKSVQSSSKYQTTTIFEIDPISLAVRRRFDIDAQPHDMVATDQGLLFLTGAAGGWSELLAVDVKAGSIVGRWGGIWTRSLVQQTASPPRLYVATQGVTPGKIEIFPIPVELSVKPASRAAVTDDPIGGPFRITPDGRFLLSQTGTLLRLSDDKNDDLRPAGKLPPHLASAIDPALGVALLLEENGTTLRRYSYPEWQWRGSYELPSLNHGLAFDSATNRVFVATIDPRSLRDRPRAKGHGEVRVYQVPE